MVRVRGRARCVGGVRVLKYPFIHSFVFACSKSECAE